MSTVDSNERLLSFHEEIRDYHRGLPNPGCRGDGLPFENEMKTMDCFFYFANSLYGMDFLGRENYCFFDSGDGGPLLSEPYHESSKWCNKIIFDNEMRRYGFASGDKFCREKVASYLTSEGFITYPGKSINVNQIIFTNSVTEAFSLTMQLICQPGDIILFSSPTYGLLSYIPERIGAYSKFIPLRRKNDWFVDPDELNSMIKEINKSLSVSDNATSSNRVVAYVNINPHNPIGNVMGKRHYYLLQKISKVCRENGVYVIDDLIYRELCYDFDNRAYPVAAINGEFDNTITLFGVSKSFGMPAARAGAIFANEAIIRGIRNEIFRLMDSTSLTVSYIMAGAFNNDLDKRTYFCKYISQNAKAYNDNWKLLHAIVTGKLAQIDEDAISMIRTFFNESFFSEKNGIPHVELANGIVPESGFFAILDFTHMIGTKICSTDERINDERDVVTFFYKYARVKLLSGSSVIWPDPSMIVARFSFAFPAQDLIRMLGQMYNSIKEYIV